MPSNNNNLAERYVTRTTNTNNNNIKKRQKKSSSENVTRKILDEITTQQQFMPSCFCSPLPTPPLSPTGLSCSFCCCSISIISSSSLAALRLRFVNEQRSQHYSPSLSVAPALSGERRAAARREAEKEWKNLDCCRFLCCCCCTHFEKRYR